MHPRSRWHGVSAAIAGADGASDAAGASDGAAVPGADPVTAEGGSAGSGTGATALHALANHIDANANVRPRAIIGTNQWAPGPD